MNRDCSNCLCDKCDKLEHCPVSPKHKDPIRPDPCVNCLKGQVYVSNRASCPEYSERHPSCKQQLADAIKAALAEKLDNTLLPEPGELDSIQVYIRTTANHIRIELEASNDILWRMQPC